MNLKATQNFKEFCFRILRIQQPNNSFYRYNWIKASFLLCMNNGTLEHYPVPSLTIFIELIIA